jgi:hypothetical protein
MKWTKRYAAAWLIWLAVSGVSFLALEAVGLGCEWFSVLGCSTLSSWMVANWGPVFMVTATGAVATVASWHWVTVYLLQQKEKKQQERT